MKRPKFVTDGIYHVYNRGVEKRDVFMNEKDYFRFIHDMYEFNDENPALNLNFYFGQLSKSDFQSKTAQLWMSDIHSHRKKLVEILCFCLMPNHYHFLLRQLVDGGITEFMRKIGGGYTNYFNTKNERVGSLFQGKFKAIHIQSQSHLLYLPHYIHLNPLDLYLPEWRSQKLRNADDALKFLESYRWSSLLDYIGKKNYPSVISKNFLAELYYGSPTSIVDYRKDLMEWLKNMDLTEIQDVTLE